MLALWKPDVKRIMEQEAQLGVVAPINRLNCKALGFVLTKIGLPSLFVALFMTQITNIFSAIPHPNAFVLYGFGLLMTSGVALFLMTTLFLLDNVPFTTMFAELKAKHLQLLVALMVFNLLPTLMLLLLPAVGYFFCIYFFVSASFFVALIFDQNLSGHHAVFQSLVLSFGKWFESFLLIFMPILLFFALNELLKWYFPLLQQYEILESLVDWLVLTLLLPWFGVSYVTYYQYLLFVQKNLQEINNGPSGHNKQPDDNV